MENARINTNGIHLNVVMAGPVEGPLVILLHGFPEFSYGWRHQVDELADAGYRVWAPDQRGYNLSDKPRRINDYRIDNLAADVIGLIDAAGCKTAYIVGHDWGAAVAWYVAEKYPERVKKLVVMNVPNGRVMAEHLKHNPAQRKKSWYMFFFQLPWLPEFLLSRKNWAFAVRMLQSSSHDGAFTEADLEQYRQAWSQPRAFRSMINWYRAFLQRTPTAAKSSAAIKITVPTLLIWGKQDTALGSEMAQPSIDLCEDGQLVFFEEATHWVQHDEPERVNRLLQSFLQ
ncbi:MAG: alpha/beta hydrolase [Anaerolineae bacterium]|jgi:pimeloyl-ACP methyl ester carboxylesterase|nr:alpha/beta hydrolase [Anaerolineae bacterium]